MGKLLEGKEYQVLLDTGASKSFMSKSRYLCCKSLHSLPKFASRTQRIQVGNGQFVSVLFMSHRGVFRTIKSFVHALGTGSSMTEPTINSSF